MNNIASLTKLHHEMTKLRERAEKAEGELAEAQAELQKLRDQRPVAWLIPQSALVTFDEDWAHENPDYCDPLFLAPMAAPAAPAPSVPEEWREKLLAEFPLFDEEGLCQEKHHCEWTLLQDRKRLHALLQSVEVAK